MKEISIQKGEGVSQAIKRQLKEEGVSEEQFRGSVWSKIHQALKDNESKISHKGQETKIGDAWDTLRTNVKTYVDDILKIADTTWSKIKELFNVSGSGASGGATGAKDTGAAEDVEAPVVVLTQENEPSVVDKRRNAAKAKVKELKKLFDKTPVPMKEVKSILEEADKKNLTAYIVEQYPDLADKIDGVFRFGLGFDKKDVYNMVLKPLMKRADELNIKYSNKEELSEKMDFSKMKAAITNLSKAIRDKELSIYAKQASKAEEKANKALGKLAEAVNTKPEVEKDEKRKLKQCTLADGTGIIAYYDNSGEIQSISLYFADDNNTNDNVVRYSIVSFDQNGVRVYADGDYNNELEFGQKSSNYDYDAILALAKKIFGEWDD